MTPTLEQLLQWFTPAHEESFWAKVEKQTDELGCWVWTGSLSDTGHGQYRMLGGVARTHRLSWMMARQRDIPGWMVIRHMCNVRPCCNPRHLIGGTQGENVEDIFIQAAFDRTKDELARLEYLANPYVGYFSEKMICNRGYEDNVRNHRLHIVNPSDSDGMYTLPATA